MSVTARRHREHARRRSSKDRRFERLKLCHVIKATSVGGAENHLLALLPRLDAAKFDVSLTVLVEPRNSMRSWIDSLTRQGIHVNSLPIRGNLDPLALASLWWSFERARYDLLHTHLIHADLYAGLAARLNSFPIVVSTRHNDNRFRTHPFYAWLNRQSAKTASRIIAVSSYLREFIAAAEGIPKDKIVVIRHGLDLNSSDANREGIVCRELGIPPTAPVAAIVARLTEQKGHTYLLQAFAEVIRTIPDARLLIVGSGSLMTALQSLVNRLGLGSNVIFTGYRSDARALMSEVNLIVLSSLWEGFGLVLLEAMAAAKPVVATDVSAIQEVVEHKVTGLLVPPRDPQSLARAIIELLQDPHEAQRMGRAGRQRVEALFTIEGMIQQTEAVYEGLMRERLSLYWDGRTWRRADSEERSADTDTLHR